MKTLFDHSKWRWIDQSTQFLHVSPLQSFAMDDTLCHVVGRGLSEPIVRTWVHAKSVVLGIQDHRLPNVEQATAFIEQQGYAPIVRNSGGLAVVLDEGVLNISLIFPDNKLSIDASFERMVQFVRAIFPKWAEQIEVYEIVGSYCPGTYDLSIGGKKFAGISQRRMQNGIAVQIYICIEGSGEERAAFIRDFYAIGLAKGEAKYTYPQVNPSVMASLQTLTNDISLTVASVNERIYDTLHMLCENVFVQPFNEQEHTLYETYTERMEKRNASLLK